jgi:hypothetical protein
VASTPTGHDTATAMAAMNGTASILARAAGEIPIIQVGGLGGKVAVLRRDNYILWTFVDIISERYGNLCQTDTPLLCALRT